MPWVFCSTPISVSFLSAYRLFKLTPQFRPIGLAVSPLRAVAVLTPPSAELVTVLRSTVCQVGHCPLCSSQELIAAQRGRHCCRTTPQLLSDPGRCRV